MHSSTYSKWSNAPPENLKCFSFQLMGGHAKVRWRLLYHFYNDKLLENKNTSDKSKGIGDWDRRWGWGVACFETIYLELFSSHL